MSTQRKMRLAICILLVGVMKMQAQTNLIGPINPFYFQEIPHENEWLTGIMTSGNIYVTILNARNFKNAERKSNAGFLLFPGLFQLAAGAMFQEPGDVGREINIAVGVASTLFTAARMLYPSKPKENRTVYLNPWYLPNKGAAGLSFKVEF